MLIPAEHCPDAENVYDYLCVDRFLSTFMSVQSLKCAFEIGLIDRMLRLQPCVTRDLVAGVAADLDGILLLLDLLGANRVVEQRCERFCLSVSFQRALRFRDLLQAKIDFANLVAPDVAIHFNSLITDPHQFMRRANLFDLFNYKRCLTPTREYYHATRRWMRFTTALTRYEAKVCLQRHDFSRYRHFLDVGGNSGEFALQVCRQHPRIRATVVDLPLVCDIGAEHVSTEPESSRISFIKGDALKMKLPSSCDVLGFKSVLHDWPEDAVRVFIRKAGRALDSGGTLLIFERGPISPGGIEPSYATIPILLFFRFYRDPSIYLNLLAEAGFHDVGVEHIQLDTPFFLISATKT